MPTALFLAPYLPLLFASVGLTTFRGSAIGLITISLFFGIPTLWGWYRYFTASVRTNEDGITQHASFQQKYIPWSQVEKVYKSGDGTSIFGNVIGSRSSIRFWMGIADVESLRKEIESRSVYATVDWPEP